jgi:hypothetical protein
MDDYSREQERSREVLSMREELRKDLEAAVRKEVQEVGYSEAHLRRKVTGIAREMVREQQRSWPARVQRWLPLVLALALVGGWEWWDHLQSGTDALRPAGQETPAESAAPDPDVARGDSGVAGDAPPAGGPVVAAPATAVARGSAYDSLLRAGGAELGEAVRSLRGVGTIGVVAVVDGWLADPSGLSAEQRRRLHSALLQQAMNRERGLSLVVDGNVLRAPCGGSSCPRFRELWQDPAGVWDLPDYPAGGNPSADELLSAERAWLYQVLVGG